MFRSIKTRMLLFVIGILVVTALVLMLFTKKDIEQHTLETEGKSIQNVIYLVKLNIESQYGSLLYSKMSTVEKRKNDLKKLNQLVISVANYFEDLHAKGILHEESAKAFALEWINSQKYTDDSYVFVYDEKCTLLAHPDCNVLGSTMSHIRDIKGLGLFESMMHKARTTGAGFTIFSWDAPGSGQPSKQIGYFAPYSKWKWMVAAAINIEDIEVEHKREFENIVQELKENFEKIKIASSGYLFLFNGKKEIIIHPELTGNALSSVRNTLTGNLLLDDLMAAAATPAKPLEYLWEDESGKEANRRFESYVDYFKTLDWYIASSTSTEELKLPARAAVFRQLFFIGIVFVTGIALTYLLVRRIAQPIKKLTEYAKELPSHDFTSTETTLSGIEHLPIEYRDEVGKLAESFIFMEKELRQYIADLKETTAAKERIESELKIASDIQMSLIPKIFPPFPDRTEIDLFATLKPAKEVGGDLYDFFFIDNDHLFFVVGDVSGKGVPASLFMAVARTLIRAGVEKNATPGDILHLVNNKISEDNDACLFVTIFCGILDMRTGEMLYTNGGHNPPLLISSSKSEVRYVELPDGMALGIMEDSAYRTERLVLAPGDVLLAYTDGVTEAMDANRQLYSEQRLIELIRGLRHCPVEEMSKHLMKNIADYSQNVPQSDDITVLALEYKGS